MVKPPIREPKTAPPLKLELIAPIVADVFVVLKYFRKLFEPMESFITPAPYPKRKEVKATGD